MGAMGGGGIDIGVGGGLYISGCIVLVGKILFFLSPFFFSLCTGRVVTLCVYFQMFLAEGFFLLSSVCLSVCLSLYIFLYVFVCSFLHTKLSTFGYFV